MGDRERDDRPRPDEADRRGEGDEGDDRPEREAPPETSRHPAPGIEHEPEPSGENLIPAKDRPGTL